MKAMMLTISQTTKVPKTKNFTLILLNRELNQMYRDQNQNGTRQLDEKLL